MTLDHYQYTGRGGRAENQDYAAQLLLPRGALWALADGVGGHGFGRMAAVTAVECFAEQVRAGKGLRLAAGTANERLLQLQKRQAAGLPMACTLVAALLQGKMLAWAHVGDSRFYFFRAGRLLFQTEDDSVCQALAKLGEIPPQELRASPDRNRLLHTLGEQPFHLHCAEEIEILPGDAFLLCSDGFWEGVYEEEMLIDLCKSRTAREWGEHMLCRLLSRQGPEADNYTLQCCILGGAGREEALLEGT